MQAACQAAGRVTRAASLGWLLLAVLPTASPCAGTNTAAAAAAATQGNRQVGFWYLDLSSISFLAQHEFHHHSTLLKLAIFIRQAAQPCTRRRRARQRPRQCPCGPHARAPQHAGLRCCCTQPRCQASAPAVRSCTHASRRDANAQRMSSTCGMLVVGPPNERDECHIVTIRQKHQAGVMQARARMRSRACVGPRAACGRGLLPGGDGVLPAHARAHAHAARCAVRAAEQPVRAAPP